MVQLRLRLVLPRAVSWAGEYHAWPAITFRNFGFQAQFRLIGAAAVVVLLAVLASLVPAARAARVDTMQALRAQ